MGITNVITDCFPVLLDQEHIIHIIDLYRSNNNVLIGSCLIHSGWLHPSSWVNYTSMFPLLKPLPSNSLSHHMLQEIHMLLTAGKPWMLLCTICMGSTGPVYCFGSARTGGTGRAWLGSTTWRSSGHRSVVSRIAYHFQEKKNLYHKILANHCKRSANYGHTLKPCWSAIGIL